MSARKLIPLDEAYFDELFARQEAEYAEILKRNREWREEQERWRRHEQALADPEFFDSL